ncbi:MAG: TIGR04282 family arsenosugar biosynthesis glycosyltransferase [Saprospiraceae bacterium]|nr:TIGR04282 family arsenosugar biosynthesis glycosyltransferase [Saprospiraceae bacterium]
MSLKRKRRKIISREDKISCRNDQNVLVLFAKTPQKGNVKTRIAKTHGIDMAFDVYVQLLSQAMKTINCVNDIVKQLYYTPLPFDQEYLFTDFDALKMQEGTDLGNRMSNVFRNECIHNSHVVLIGSDVPEISPEIIHQAFYSLSNHDVVLGPSMDGGYYLIGMKQHHPTLFENIHWSTEQVLIETIEKIEKIGLTFNLVDPLNDIDEFLDWENFLISNPNII